MKIQNKNKVLNLITNSDFDLKWFLHDITDKNNNESVDHGLGYAFNYQFTNEYLYCSYDSGKALVTLKDRIAIIDIDNFNKGAKNGVHEYFSDNQIISADIKGDDLYVAMAEFVGSETKLKKCDVSTLGDTLDCTDIDISSLNIPVQGSGENRWYRVVNLATIKMNP